MYLVIGSRGNCGDDAMLGTGSFRRLILLLQEVVVLLSVQEYHIGDVKKGEGQEGMTCLVVTCQGFGRPALVFLQIREGILLARK